MIYWFSADHYYSQTDEGLFISVFSDKAFDYVMDEPGEKEPFGDCSGEAIPCYVSKLLSETYLPGKTYTIAGSEYCVCGVLSTDRIYYMSSVVNGPGFIMTSDRYERPCAEYVNSCIFAKTDKSRIDKVFAALDNEGAVRGYELFDHRTVLKNEFSAVSGILLIGAWIAVIATIGQLANNYLTYKKNERDYLMMICMGARRCSITGLYVLRLLFCGIISFPVAAAASKAAASVQGIELSGVRSMILSLGIAMVIELISVLIIELSFKRRRCLYGV